MSENTRKFKQLINPHSHSHYSLDGASSIKQIVNRNIELGATHVCLTEHGNLNSGVELYHTCLKTKGKIKPILGIELYIQPPFMEEIEKEFMSYYRTKNNWDEKMEKKVRRKIEESYVHLTVHFVDEWAYQYFCRLTPKMEENAIVRYGERKPVCTLEDLEKASGHITICSSCLVGFTQRFLSWEIDRENNVSFSRPDLAEKAYNYIREIAGKDKFFVEIFPHTVTHNWSGADNCFKAIGKDLQLHPNLFTMQMARKNNDPMIISLDSHFALPEQKIIQDTKLSNGEGTGWKFYSSYHIMSTDEAANMMMSNLNLSERDIHEMVDNSYKWASNFDNFKLTLNDERWVLQPLPEDWQKWLREKIAYYGRMNWQDPAMVKRLKTEIDVLTNNGTFNLVSYLTIPEMVSQFCREQKIIMSVRGSAGGSLLLYLLGISSVNPIFYDLSFERFITLGRIKANTPPDVDMDFSDKEKVLEMLHEKFGDNFAQLSMDTKLRLKSALKDTDRLLSGHVRPEIEKFCSKLSTPPQGVDDYEWVFGRTEDDVFYPGLLQLDAEVMAFSQKYKELWDIAISMLGIVRNKSTHPCGVIITDKPVQEYAPVINLGGTRLCGLSPKAAETAGLIKYDFLTVEAYKKIGDAIELIHQRHGIQLDWANLPHDPFCYEEFGKGKTEGVFQFDTPTIKPFVLKVKPKNIPQKSNLTALGRPGTLDAPYGDGRTLAEVYVARALGEKIEYIHPELEPILKDTYGIQLFQEQTLRIFRDLAEMSFEEAEVVRRGIGKKEREVLASATGRLKDRCMGRGWTEAQVNLLIEQIMASANYSFNKCIAGSERFHRDSLNSKQRHYTIAEMYKLKNDLDFAKSIKGGKSMRSKYNMSGYGKAYSLSEDGRLHPNNIVDIYYQGTREVFEVTTESGKKIKTTINHKFPTEQGEKLLENMKVGDKIFTLAGYEKSDSTFRYNVPNNLPAKGQRGFQTKEFATSTVFLERSEVFKKQTDKCTQCDCVLTRKETHHKDGDHGNQDWENLEIVCPSCHKKAHYKMGRVKKGEKGLLTQLEAIVKIESVGFEEVYDVEMGAPNHTFLTNNHIVTSNSHSTAYAVCAYACLYLKTKYPLEWWASVLSNVSKADVSNKFWNKVSHFVDLPDINKSHASNFVIEGERLISPLSLLNGLGEKGFTQLVANRPYNSIEHFCELNLKKRKKVEGLSAIDISTSYSLIAGGLMDSLFPPEFDTIEMKLYHFNKVYAEVRKEPAKPIPPGYLGIRETGRYLARKELIPTYSADLRPIILPERYGVKQEKTDAWKLENGVLCYDGYAYDYIAHKAAIGEFGEGMVFSFIGYVIDEKIKAYQNKKKKMTQLIVDINGRFLEQVIWPDFGSDEAVSGFKKLIVVMYYRIAYNKKEMKNELRLAGVAPITQRHQVGSYNL